MVAGNPFASAQTTIYTTNFGASENVNPSGWTFTGLDMNISTHSPRSTLYTGASGQCYLGEGNSSDFTNTFGTFFSNSQPGISTATLLVNTTGYSNITVSFGMRKSSGYNNDVTWSLQWSANGITYTPITFTEPAVGTWGLASGSGLNLPGGAGNQATLYLKWTFNRTGPNFGLNFRLDDFSVTGNASTCISPAITSVSSNSPICAGVNLNLSTSASGTGTITYSWTGPNGFSSTLQNPAITGATTTASGIYTVTATNSCGSASATTSVTVNPLPAANITPGGNTTFCQGGSVTLTASAGTSYLWSNNATTSSINVSSSGNYTVQVTNANGCSATSSATQVIVNPLPTATITPDGNTTFCQGDSVLLAANTGASYLWSNNATSQSIYVTAAGNYSVTITYSGGCTGTSSAIQITINPLPSPPVITADGNTTFCQGDSVVLTSSSSAGYLWTTNETSQSITADTSGNYIVTISDVNGCRASSAPVTVTVNPLPSTTITADGPTSFCPGGSVTLMVSASVSYLWSTGETTQSIFVDTTGTYTVTITDINGCINNNSASPAIVTIVTDPTDINRDGVTNNVDFLLFLSQFNTNCAQCREDINHDGVVNNVDFLLLLARFNMMCQ